MKEENLEALPANMDIIIAGLKLKVNLTHSTAWNTGEAGDRYDEKLLINVLPNDVV